jgi:peptide/nickel transport system ATP-binding protein
MNILEVKNLNMSYKTIDGEVEAVKDVSFTVKEGESFGIVGESGCGKTSVAMSLLQLQADNGKITSGEIIFDGTNIVGLSESELREVRWSGISIVFQGAMNSWNPVVKIGEQIREAMREHYPDKTKEENTTKILELFGIVGLDSSIIDRFPHELSGGMKQRAVIALALSCGAQLMIGGVTTKPGDGVGWRAMVYFC